MIVNIESNAKINLGLNIIGKNKKNYHLLDMVMVPISLADKLSINFKDIKGNLTIKTNIKGLPTGKDNIVFKIYELFYLETKLEKKEIEIYIEKKIPSQAGLGGGSSNGAFFFNELNKYYDNIIPLERAIEITKDVGADIPFFLINKPTRVNGIGEKLEVIKNNIEDNIILIKPNFGVSTVVAYKNYSKLKERKDANIEKIIEKMNFGERKTLEGFLENHLEQALLLDDKNIINFRRNLEKISKEKNINFFMSGSGSCYYTFVKKDDIDLMYNMLKTTIEDCQLERCSFL